MGGPLSDEKIHLAIVEIYQKLKKPDLETLQVATIYCIFRFLYMNYRLGWERGGQRLQKWAQMKPPDTSFGPLSKCLGQSMCPFFLLRFLHSNKWFLIYLGPTDV